MLALANIGTLSLKGKVKLIEGSHEIVDEIKNVFGDNVFNKTSDFYIQAPEGVYLSGSSKLLEGESTRYICAVFSEEEGTIQFSLVTSRQGCSIDKLTGVLTTTENGLATSDIVVRAVFIADSGQIISATQTVTIEKRTYPTAIEITGDALMSSDTATFNLVTTPLEINGLYTVNWTLGEEAAEYLEIDSFNNTSCTLRRIKEGVVETALTATMVKNVDGTITNTVTKSISLVIEGVVITKSSNAPLQECLYKNGLVAHEDYSEEWELALITADQLQPGTTYNTSIFYPYINRITSLSELKYFTGLTSIPAYLFNGGYGANEWKFTSIEIPEGVKVIGSYAFTRTRALKKITIPSTLEKTEPYSFSDCYYIEEVHISSIQDWCKIQIGNYGTPFIQSSSIKTHRKVFIDGKEIKEVIFDFPFTTNAYTFIYWEMDKWIVSNPDSSLDNGFSNITGDLYLNCNYSNRINGSFDSLHIGENVTMLDLKNSGNFDVYIDSLEHWFNMEFPNYSSNPLRQDYSLYISNEKVSDIVIPDSVTELKANTFVNWNGISAIRIPQHVTKIASKHIVQCANLNTISVDELNPVYDSRDNCNAVILSSEDKLILGCTNTNIVEGIKVIDSTGFVNFTKDTLDLPSTLEEVIETNLRNNNTISKINLHSLRTWVLVGENLTNSYQSRSLYLNGELIEDFIIPEDIETIKGRLFYNISLNSITIPASVKEATVIGYMSLITKVIILSRRDYLKFGSETFYNNKNFLEVHVDNLEAYMYCNFGYGSGFFSSTRANITETKLFVNNELVENLELTSDLYSIAKNSPSGYVPPFTNIGSIKSVYVKEGWKEFVPRMFSGCLSLQTIYSDIINSQSIIAHQICFGNSESDYTGRNTYNTGENILYVPQGATGYDTGQWLDPLQNAEKCGFTISYTL